MKKAIKHSPYKDHARKSLNRAYQYIKIVRTLFITFAIIFGAMFAIILVINPEDYGFTKIYCAVMTVVCVVGAIQIFHQPFFWTLIAALLGTPYFLQAGGSLGCIGIFFLICTISLWIAVVMTYRARHYMRKFPDLYVSRKLSGRKK